MLTFWRNVAPKEKCTKYTFFVILSVSWGWVLREVHMTTSRRIRWRLGDNWSHSELWWKKSNKPPYTICCDILNFWCSSFCRSLFISHASLRYIAWWFYDFTYLFLIFKTQLHAYGVLMFSCFYTNIWHVKHFILSSCWYHMSILLYCYQWFTAARCKVTCRCVACFTT